MSRVTGTVDTMPQRGAFAAYLLAAVTLGALAGCTGTGRHIGGLRASPAETRLPAPSLELPFEAVRGIPLLEARIDGQGPFRLLLDTGNQAAAVLAPRVVRQLALSDEGPAHLRGATGETVEAGARVRRVHRLEIAGTEFRDFPVVEVDISGLESAAGTRIDGLLGFALFWDCLLTIDYPAGRVGIARGVLPDPDGREYLALAAGTAWPMTSLDVGPVHLPALIDSGDAGVGLSIPLSSVPRLPFSHAPVDGHGGRSLGREFRERVGRLGVNAALGRHVFERPVVRLIPRDHARIGAEALKHFAVTFDQQRNVVRFARVGSDLIRSRPLRTLGIEFTPGPDGPLVADVIPGTPAAALDIQRGDRLRVIDGRPIAEFSAEAFDRMLEERSELVLVFERGGRRIEVRVRVVDLVP